MEAARRASDALARMQETIASLEQNNGRTAQDVAALRKTDEQISAAVKATRAAEETTAKKADQVDKRTEGAMTTTSKFPVKIYANVLISGPFADRGANTNDLPPVGQQR